jgi:predicted amino acid dehydrogenase
MNRTALATITGLVLGLALVFGSFGDMLIVGLFGLIGFVIAKVLDGELDVQGWLSRGRYRR